MELKFEQVTPAEIERRSFEIIESELPHPIDHLYAPIVKRVIHTTADFSYADSLCFSPDALESAFGALREGACIVTDTNMAKAGVNKPTLARHGGEVRCFMADEDVRLAAKERGTTRAAVSMEKACGIDKPLIFAIGNAPTALFSICELIRAGKLNPEMVIGVPVGFVNVVEAKEELIATAPHYIVARGRKGGSNVAAAIVNAVLYQMVKREE